MTVPPKSQRQLERHLQSESRWLQKVLFALGKARQAREKLAEIPGRDPDPLIQLSDGTRIPLDNLEEIIRARVADLMAELGQGTHRLRG